MKTTILFTFLLIGSIFQQSFAQNVGIQQAAPASRLDVNGNLTIGSTYSGTAAPVDGAIIEGNLGVGTNAPTAKLDVSGNWKLGTGGNVNNGLRTLRWSWGLLNVNTAGTSVRLTGTNSVLGIPQNCAVFVSYENSLGNLVYITHAWMEADAVGFIIKSTTGTQPITMTNMHYTFIW